MVFEQKILHTDERLPGRYEIIENNNVPLWRDIVCGENGADASAASAYINNTDSVFLGEDMKGNWRVVGCDKWQTKATVAQDLGQGPTGTTSTTISVEATDEVPAPFYRGTIETEDGDIDCSGSSASA